MFYRKNVQLGVIIVTIIGLWAVGSGLGIIPRGFFPSPGEVVKALVQMIITGTLWNELGKSLVRMVQYYVVASILGLSTGLLLGMWSAAARFARPLLNFANSLSGIAWLPLAMMWFGIGEPTIGFVTANGVFFVVAVNTIAGVQAVPRAYEYGLRVLGAGRIRIILQVLIPGAIPSVLNGLRLGLGFGWRALIAAEMAAAPSGIGYLIYQSSYNFRNDVMVASILLLGIVALALDRVIFTFAERRTMERWGMA
ncbi:ABC transporter permease [Thermaerobacter composti]|uniref:ABC transporter permease n=1 Tax=Thermaerobacter composti TaxID=554949 RepID=A0ABZ0QM08_9FIRM|nr:ABC transporter permease [Thermaerobacter composti]WPD18523.1 ABC transporter permease [Thermaerobacter composti]